MLDFFWDLHQQKGIAEAKTDESQAKEAVRSQNDRVRELEFTVQRMALASQAMWELLRSRFEMDEEDLLARIKEIDLRDGRLDGRMQAQASKCSNCGRLTNAKNPRCIYCGSPVKQPHVFQ